MARERMLTPVQPFIVNAKDYESPDYMKGAVMRLEGRMGRPPGMHDEDGNELPGLGLLGDVAVIKQRLGRPPQTHGMDDPGEGMIAHVYEQRRRQRRTNYGTWGAALLALVTSLAAVAHSVAQAMQAQPAQQPPAALPK